MFEENKINAENNINPEKDIHPVHSDSENIVSSENKVEQKPVQHKEHKEPHHVHHKPHEHKKEVHHKDHHKKKSSKLNSWKISTIVLIALLVISLFTGGFGLSNNNGIKEKSIDEVSEETISYINDVLLQGQATAELVEKSEEAGLYKLKMNIADNELDSYVTKDGNLLFPQAIDMNEELPLAEDNTEPVAQDLVKSDKPKVELFVMSHCPYGTQAEKGILPAIEQLGDNVDFEVKFVFYAMHGKTELDEQAKQVCIMQEEGESKYYNYLKCFLDGGDSKADDCMQNAEINTDAIEVCVDELDQEYGITAAFEDKSSWLSGRYPLFDVYKELNEEYNVGGSPTLIINGAQAESGRSPAAYLETICGAFNEAPEECDVELSETTYSPGFGYDVGADTTASCG